MGTAKAHTGGAQNAIPSDIGSAMTPGRHAHPAGAAARGRVVEVVLAECEGLVAEELLAVTLDLGEAALAVELVAVVVHLNVVLRVALGAVGGEELAVAAIEDVHLRVGEMRVAGGVDIAVVIADKLGRQRGAVDRVLAVEHEQGLRSILAAALAEEIVGEVLLVVKIDGILDVSTLVFVFESTVNDEDAVVVVAVFRFQYIYHGVLRDSW